MTDLQSTWAGIPLRNPFLLASAPPTGTQGRLIDAAAAGWGGAVTKTLTSTPQYARNLARSIDSARSRGWRQIGILNNELVTEGTIDDWCDELLPRVRAEIENGFCLGVSVMEGADPDEWASTCARLSEHATYLEMNVSCPHGQPEKYRGTYIGDDPELLAAVVSGAVAGASVPVAVKLNALSPTLVASGAAALESGAAALVTTNTFAALPPVERLLDLDDITERVTPMGISGAAVLPVNRLATASLVASLRCEVASVGGVSSAADALDYLMLGAKAIQVGTAAMLKGPSLIDTLIHQLEQRLIRAGRSSVTEVIGSALPHLTTAEEEQHRAVRVAKVDMRHCTLCNACVQPCATAGADCLTLTADALEIAVDRCTGCGLCVIICPTDALTLIGQD
jgi:dihydropyrimidine dehydrogenase (NAD+) subunit PreA